MEPSLFLNAVQKYVANIAIGASSLRNLGAKGVVSTAREFLAGLDLMSLERMSPNQYADWLDERTDELRDRFPREARKWGAARKALNIFLCHAYLNRPLCEAYRLERLAHVMETPLDSVVATKLREKAPNGTLPRWPGVGRLTQKVSQQYQEFATEHAKEYGVPRGCLDAVLWERQVG